MRACAVLFACLAAAAAGDVSIERSSFAPGAVGTSGNFALVSSAGQSAAGDGAMLESGSLAGLVPIASDTAIGGFTASIGASGDTPILTFSSAAEAAGAEFLLHRAVPFAGGWIAGDRIGAAAAAGAGTDYAISDPDPYVFGEAERRYLLEIAEPGGARAMIGPVSLCRDAAASQDAWTIL